MYSERLKGAHAEDQAIEYLLLREHKFIKRNIHTRYGEIDLLMQEGNELVFVEVKSGKDFATCFMNLSPLKLIKMYKSAELILSSYSYEFMRFDAILVNTCLNEIQWIRALDIDLV